MSLKVFDNGHDSQIFIVANKGSFSSDARGQEGLVQKTAYRIQPSEANHKWGSPFLWYPIFWMAQKLENPMISKMDDFSSY